jgi:hypothetical protein
VSESFSEGERPFEGPDSTPFKKADGILYHYCSNASFLSIISTRTVWASEYSLSNDALEGKWIRKVVEECCNDGGLSASQLGVVLKEFDTFTSMHGAAGICLSEEGDLLSQWRAYSENGAGVSIGFDSAAFYEEPEPPAPPPALPPLSKVIYEVATQKQIIAPNIDQICKLLKSGADVATYRDVEMPDGVKLQVNENETLNMTIVTLLALLYAFKNPAFGEEREWRGSNIVGMIAELDVKEPDVEKRRKQEIGWALHNMDYRALADRIVPYRSFSLDTKTPAIREVVLGPRNISPILIVQEALRRYGWKNVSVRKSTASYR